MVAATDAPDSVDLPIGRDKAIPAAWAGRFRSLLEWWRISGITTMQTGSYFNPKMTKMAGDFNSDGVRADRLGRVASGELPRPERSIDRRFATEAFVAPPQYGFGNCGRNILMATGKHKRDISIIKGTGVKA